MPADRQDLLASLTADSPAWTLVRSLADRVVVLSRGKVVVIETPEAVAQHAEVLEHYLGQPASTVAPLDTDGATR